MQVAALHALYHSSNAPTASGCCCVLAATCILSEIKETPDALVHRQRLLLLLTVVAAVLFFLPWLTIKGVETTAWQIAAFASTETYKVMFEYLLWCLQTQKRGSHLDQILLLKCPFASKSPTAANSVRWQHKHSVIFLQAVLGSRQLEATGYLATGRLDHIWQKKFTQKKLYFTNLVILPTENPALYHVVQNVVRKCCSRMLLN